MKLHYKSLLIALLVLSILGAHLSVTSTPSHPDGFDEEVEFLL